MNQVIHFIFIPTIVFCVLSLSKYYPLYEFKTNYGMTFLIVDPGVILLACVFPVYIMIDKLTGFVSVITYSVSFYLSI